MSIYKNDHLKVKGRKIHFSPWSDFYILYLKIKLRVLKCMHYVNNYSTSMTCYLSVTRFGQRLYSGSLLVAQYI